MANTNTPETWQKDEKGRWFMVKDPDDVLDYSVDWTAWLAPEIDSIASHQIILPTDTGLTIVSDTDDGQVVTVFLSGGNLNKLEPFTVRITTASTPPRVRDWTLYLKIKEK